MTIPSLRAVVSAKFALDGRTIILDIIDETNGPHCLELFRRLIPSHSRTGSLSEMTLAVTEPYPFFLSPTRSCSDALRWSST
jgi:hypothetical protein